MSDSDFSIGEGRGYWAAGRLIIKCQSHLGQPSTAAGNDGVSIGRRMSNHVVECGPNNSMYDIIIGENCSEAFDQGNEQYHPQGSLKTHHLG